MKRRFQQLQFRDCIGCLKNRDKWLGVTIRKLTGLKIAGCSLRYHFSPLLGIYPVLTSKHQCLLLPLSSPVHTLTRVVMEVARVAIQMPLCY